MQRDEPTFQQLDLLGRRALLRSEDDGRVGERRFDVARDQQFDALHASRARAGAQRAQPAVGRRRSAEADDQMTGARVERGGQQFADAGGCRADRIVVLGATRERDAARLRRLDDRGGAVESPRRVDDAAERSGDRRRPVGPPNTSSSPSPPSDIGARSHVPPASAAPLRDGARRSRARWRCRGTCRRRRARGARPLSWPNDDDCAPSSCCRIGGRWRFISTTTGRRSRPKPAADWRRRSAAACGRRDVLWVAAAMSDADRAAGDAGADGDMHVEGYRFRLVDIPQGHVRHRVQRRGQPDAVVLAPPPLRPGAPARARPRFPHRVAGVPCRQRGDGRGGGQSRGA